MPVTQVFFASRERAEAFSGAPETAVISITDPGSPPARLDPKFGPILRLSFYDAVPADEYLPAPMGLFDHGMARQVLDFVGQLHATEPVTAILVHCEFGRSRSAAVALFVEAWTGARLSAREFAFDANHWVIDRLTQLLPDLEIDIPIGNPVAERRRLPRCD